VWRHREIAIATKMTTSATSIQHWPGMPKIVKRPISEASIAVKLDAYADTRLTERKKRKPRLGETGLSNGEAGVGALRAS
jgi:hypothetical protein